VFTEHRDTLRYLQERSATLLGRETSVVVIHGSVGREERLAAQEAFRHDPQAQVLLATDAAGEGINLQRAHLMVKYDLPWNPNRLEQRFGRIHRIGQTEVCHLWSLVADETREGDVYRRLLEKLEQARRALGGQVFDVLGKLEFEGRPLRELLLDAVRYGEQPEVRARLDTAVDQALDRSALQDLLEERQLVHDAMDARRVRRIRAEMERAEARRLQPHYVESFFLEAFRRLGGAARRREARRHQVTHVPAMVRNRDRAVGAGEPVLPRYERIAFEKSLVAPPGQPLAARRLHCAPYLDYRPLAAGDPAPAAILERPECAWISGDLEQKAQAHAVAHVVPEHLAEIRGARLALIGKTEAAVKDRLTKEINYWDNRAEQLKLEEQAGGTGARLHSGEARRRADTLQARLRKRLEELKQDEQISPRLSGIRNAGSRHG